MSRDVSSRIFVTGTDTGVGKTLVSALLVAGMEAEYWKPIQCGLEETPDREWVMQKTSIPGWMAYPEAYRLKHPLSPHAAARLDGVTIDLDSIALPPSSSSRPLIVEGAGGIMVPLNEHQYMLDLMRKLALPVLLVASSRLGTINHTLLSLEVLRSHDMEIMGVVINGPRNGVNRDAIRDYGKVRILAEVEPMLQIDLQTLKETFQREFMKGY
ncbi:MAG: dethiobiotin synthase [Desulfobacteraceae bacterium]|nr:MAG: dethiobiotin synthase [Desulfobacteraceae bacterium]